MPACSFRAYSTIRAIAISRSTRRGKNVIAYIVHLLRLSGAAYRAGEAARNHRVPSDRDLAILDLPARLFAR
jgi:hypothetical protein